MRTRIARNLYLQDTDGAQSWIFRYTSPKTKTRREMGLGPCDLIPERDAIRRAQALRRSVLFGEDPLENNS